MGPDLRPEYEDVSTDPNYMNLFRVLDLGTLDIGMKF